jgi:cell division FtsZ-interacting protein ZapD
VIRPHPGEREDARVVSPQYEIRIRGSVRSSLLEDFEGLERSVERVETVLHGPLADQAALHGLLARIEALGLELVEVRRLPQGD